MGTNTEVPEEERQPSRRGLSEPARKFDQTYLDPNAEIVHRDYAAHFFRWGFAKKDFVGHETTDVLDVGCGPDRPLMLALFGGGHPVPMPNSYTGVDMSKIKPTRHARTKLYPETNFLEAYPQILKERGPFDLITNFEVIEHMTKANGLRLLQAFKRCLHTVGYVLLSTPVYDGKGRARNHIHEYTIPELAAHIETAGFVVRRRYGTFGNIKALEKAAEHGAHRHSLAHLDTMDDLSEYYSNDVLSTFLAPLYPDACRNNLWVLQHA